MAVMLSHRNLADAAVDIAATREADGLGVRNLLTEPPTEVWRIPTVAAGTGTALNIDLGAVETVGVIAFFAPRLSYLPPAYTIALAGSAIVAGGNEVVNVGSAAMGLSANRGAWWRWFETPVAVRYWRITFRAQTGDEYLQLGRCWIGPDWRPNTLPQVDAFSRGRTDSGQVERAAISGVAAASTGRVYRTPRFTLPLLSDSEADELEDIADAAGTTRQLLIQPRSDRGAKDLVLGRFTAVPDPRAVSPVHYSAEIAYAED